METQPTPKPDFVLFDTAGQPFDFRTETDGFVTLLFFGYTSCPDICPVHMAQIASVLEDEPELRDQTKVVFVSIDPDRDTPRLLAEWLAHFDSSFIGLSGTQEQLKAAQEAAALPVAYRVEAEDGSDFYTMAHSALVLAYGPDGLGYAAYPFPTRRSDWAHDLPILASYK